MNHPLPTKGTLESVTLGFDFSDEAESVTILSLTCQVDASSTGDPNPSAVLVGDPQIDSSNPANVLQAVDGGVDGTTYLILCTVQTDTGSKLTCWRLLPVSSLP